MDIYRIYRVLPGQHKLGRQPFPKCLGTNPIGLPSFWLSTHHLAEGEKRIQGSVFEIMVMVLPRAPTLLLGIGSRGLRFLAPCRGRRVNFNDISPFHIKINYA